MQSINAHLISASGYQDHTTSPSALNAFVFRAKASTASPLTFVTIAKRPSLRDGMIRFYCCFYQAVKGNFGNSEIGRSTQIRHLERAAGYPLLGAKQTMQLPRLMSAFDPDQ